MTTPPASKPLTAAVFGGSIAGLMASLVLNKQGFEVTLYEKRTTYTRNIQWTCRQSFIDYLSWINPQIAKDFYEQLLSPITNGYRFLSDRSLRYPDGAYKHKPRNKPCPGNGVAPTECCSKSLSAPPVGIVRTKLFEKFLLETVQKTDRMTLIDKPAPYCKRSEDNSDRFVLVEDGREIPYDLIVVCEGANSTTRDSEEVGIKSRKLSRSRKQISGEVKLQRHGMIIHYQHAKVVQKKPAPELLLSSVLSTDIKESIPDDKTTCWIIGDVSLECSELIDFYESQIYKIKLAIERLTREIEETASEDAKSAYQKSKANEEASLKEYEDAKTEKENGEFREIAARTMLDTSQNIKGAGYTGAVDKVRTFSLQAKLSNRAYGGKNLVLAGDAVGDGHWSVGGGMHVAGMCHQRRLDVLATELINAPDNRLNWAQLENYQKGVRADTIAWISLGIRDFYPSIPEDVLRRVFEEVVQEVLIQETRDLSIDINAPKLFKERVAAVYFD
jgi:2-polyprenyl-6-methoxyphenol hydroxylase-like FAD-dependent oxidoreductase